MLLQYSGANLYKERDKFEYHAGYFEHVPLYFLKYFGSHDVEKVLQTVEHAIYAYDIGHVVIDNLQFLLSGQGRGFEKFDIQDDAISKLRDLATSKNVHVSLVIHPKKVDDNQDLTINSVFGSAKATQEADNIIILQNRPKYRVIEVRKNRFDGDCGKIPLGFDRDTKRFFELNESEIYTLHKTQETIKDVILKRKERNNIPDQLGEAQHNEEVQFGSSEDLDSEIFGLSQGVAKSSQDDLENAALLKLVKERNDSAAASEVIGREEGNDTPTTILDELSTSEPDYETNIQIASITATAQIVEKQEAAPDDQKSSEAPAKSDTPQVQTPPPQEQLANPQIQEQVPAAKPAEESKPVKTKEKRAGSSAAAAKVKLYGDMYKQQDTTVKHKDSFYNETDRELVKENMAYIENEKKKNYRKKVDGMNTKTQRGPDRSDIEADIDAIYKNNK